MSIKMRTKNCQLLCYVGGERSKTGGALLNIEQAHSHSVS